MPFEVKIGRIDRIFSLLLRTPKKMLNSPDIEPITIGRTNLFFPLNEAKVEIISSGETDYALKCFITLQQTQVVVKENDELKIKTRNSELKLNQIPVILVPGLKVVFINEHGYSIQTESGTEIYTIQQFYAGSPIIISAGTTGAISSPPPKEISTHLELQKELEIFASIIQAVVNTFYDYQLQICYANSNEEWAVDLIERMETNTFLYLRGPLSNDKKSSPEKDDDSSDDGDDEEDENKTTSNKDYIGGAPKPINPKKLEWTLDDVGGIDEEKKTAWQVVEFLKNPEKFSRLGAKIPKGVLLEGPPGTGKTMLAKAIAKEAGVPFFAIKGSDFVEVYVGVGAARVRLLFRTAARIAKKKKTSVIIFFDEIDAVAGRREGGSGGSQERENTLNELLGQLDGFEANNKIVVIAATNRPDMLDPAITRPGRFNRRIILPNPDLDAREAILKIHARNKTIKEGIDFRQIARTTIGFSGADIDDLLNEAAILAANRNKEAIDEEDINDARERIMLGPERKIKDMPEYERKNTAYHEAGHAFLHEYFVPLTNPIQKVTIVPRGPSLGLTVSQPTEDRHTSTKAQLLKQMCTLMGGRAAEIILSGEKNITTGARKDIEMATDIATEMVREYGMSSELGPVNLGGKKTHMYLGYRMGNSPNISPITQEIIDVVVKDLCEKALKRAISTLRENMDTLVAIANALLEKETLNGDKIRQIIEDNRKTLIEDKITAKIFGMSFARIGE